MGSEDILDPISLRSRNGYVITLGSCPVVWSSKLHSEISLSTLEEEYISMSTSMRELIPLKILLKEIGVNLKEILGDIGNLHSTVYKDYNGSLNLVKSPKMTSRSKHIEIKYHWFMDHIKEVSVYML